MNTFQQVLKAYLMCDTLKDCQEWISKQPCGPEKKKIFLNECDQAFNFEGGRFTDEEKVKDYLDALRRDYYVGMGI